MINDKPHVGQILIDPFGDECMVTSVKESTRNFMVNGRWFAFSYFGDTFKEKVNWEQK